MKVDLLNGFRGFRAAELQNLQWPTLKIRSVHGFPTHSPVIVPAVCTTAQFPMHHSLGVKIPNRCASIVNNDEYYVCASAHGQSPSPRQNLENTKQTDQTCPMVFLMKDDNERNLKPDMLVKYDCN